MVILILLLCVHGRYFELIIGGDQQGRVTRIIMNELYGPETRSRVGLSPPTRTTLCYMDVRHRQEQQITSSPRGHGRENRVIMLYILTASNAVFWPRCTNITAVVVHYCCETYYIIIIIIIRVYIEAEQPPPTSHHRPPTKRNYYLYIVWPADRPGGIGYTRLSRTARIGLWFVTARIWSKKHKKEKIYIYMYLAIDHKKYNAYKFLFLQR